LTGLDLIGHIETTEISEDAFVVSVVGPLDGRVAAELRDALMPLATRDCAGLLLDLTDAHGLDDDALSVISHAAHHVRRRGETLGIVTNSTSARDLIDSSGLLDIVTVFSSAREAISVG
jgi:anti-anti-sigma factor